jgi:hypothetical protein
VVRRIRRQVDGEDKRIAAGIGLVRISGRDLKPVDLVVPVWVRQLDIEQAVARVVGMECEAEQALFPRRRDLAPEVEEWGCMDLPGREIQDLDQAGLLDDEQSRGVARR